MVTFKTAWTNIRERSGVHIRLHDLRHTLITKLAESGAGDETIMAIAGHVSRRMLSRYAHIRTEAKRREMMQAYADYLDGLRKGAEVIPFRITQRKI